ncbi:MAG TPA: glycosyltransferase family 4 protein [Lentisphaeria bacterium]|nr:glycosyltransferase family 4 protein [Lentisphaerota bacterium]OQC17442.1 MAG: N-acetylgalactosamine-N,N'-diacetylbacillosaminyl-diphospho-undecaprenol 4-alpha-N-acetylgalactosaminyltransferase [Lentisphaerae bacterium ADurb.Bin082]HQC51522.1 glycosyltransferase family 4 protein [Lentisphaeria bacterium]HQL86246.1 glycosyltransferase family 4 protein [Lentisphaeria bacterium]
MPLTIVFYSTVGGFQGGVERFVFQSAQALQAAGVECRGVFDLPGRDPDLFRTPFATVDYGAEALSHRCSGADWLWLHKCRDCGPAAALTRRIPTAVYVHDHDYYCFRRHKYLPFKRINCPLPCGLYCLPCGLTAARQARWRDFRRNLSFVRQADLVLAGSDYMLGNLVANGFPPNRLRKLSPLVDCRSTASAEPDSRPGEILYVGQVIRGKGVDLLLQAVAQLSCPWHLTVVGEGGDLDFCRHLADRLGIADRVDFPGFTLTPERFYRQAAVMAFPSRWQEPFGMTGPEAMAMSVPVVAFDVGGVREWLHHERNGILVTANDTTAFARALESLLTDPATAARLGQQGAVDMAAYTSQEFARQVTSILANCEPVHR